MNREEKLLQVHYRSSSHNCHLFFSQIVLQIVAVLLEQQESSGVTTEKTKENEIEKLMKRTDLTQKEFKEIKKQKVDVG